MVQKAKHPSRQQRAAASLNAAMCPDSRLAWDRRLVATLWLLAIFAKGRSVQKTSEYGSSPPSSSVGSDENINDGGSRFHNASDFALAPKGRLLHRWIRWESKLGPRERKYILRLPKGYAPGKKHALIIDFHAYYDDPLYEANWSNWFGFADLHDIVMLYPSGAPDNIDRLGPEYKEYALPMPAWNALGSNVGISGHKGGLAEGGEGERAAKDDAAGRFCVPQLNGSWAGLYPCYESCLMIGGLQKCAEFPNLPGLKFNPPCVSSSCYNDTQMVSSLVEHLKEHLSIDPTNIHATGQSMGGMMALQVGSLLSSTFTSVVASSAAPLLSSYPIKDTTTVPVLLVRGLRDSIVPAEKELGYALNPDGSYCKCNGTLPQWLLQQQQNNPSNRPSSVEEETKLHPDRKVCPACPGASEDFLKSDYCISGDGYYYQLHHNFLNDWAGSLPYVTNVSTSGFHTWKKHSKRRYRTPYDGINGFECTVVAATTTTTTIIDDNDNADENCNAKDDAHCEKEKDDSTKSSINSNSSNPMRKMEKRHVPVTVSCFFDGKHCYPFQDDDCHWLPGADSGSYWPKIAWTFMQNSRDLRVNNEHRSRMESSSSSSSSSSVHHRKLNNKSEGARATTLPTFLFPSYILHLRSYFPIIITPSLSTMVSRSTAMLTIVFSAAIAAAILRRVFY